MTEEVKAQWVVRTDIGIIRLTDNRFQFRILTAEEVVSLRSYNIDDSEIVCSVDWRKRLNELRPSTTYAYWVCVFSCDPDPSMEVLCCTVHRETADRILDELWGAMFTNCGDNTYVDLRELLAADLITPEQVAATSAAGRFVDLGDGEPRRSTVVTGSVATAAIPVQTVPTRHRPGTGLEEAEAEAEALASVRSVLNQPHPLWVESSRVGSSIGRSVGHARSAMLDIADYSGVEMRAVAAAMHTDPGLQVTGPLQQSSPPGFSPQNAQSMSRAALDQALRQSTVPNIGRGMDRNADALSPRERDRLQTQLHAAVMRQQAENRNTHATILPSGVDYSEYLQPLDFADVPPVPPDNDAVDRVDPDF